MGPLFLLACCLQTPAASAPAPEPRTVNLGSLWTCSTARGDHFQVTTGFESQAVADAALAAAESVVIPAATIYGPIEPRPVGRASPIEIHIRSSGGDVYGDRSEVWSQMPVVSIDDVPPSRRLGRRAVHIPLQPPLGKRALAAAGLPGYTRTVIAREAVHLLAARSSPDPGKRLDWFDSGAAIWAAEEGLSAGGWIRDPMEEPALSTEALHVRRLAETGWLPSLEAIVCGWPGGLAAHERPAVAAHAFRFLKARPTVFARVLEAAGGFDGTLERERLLALALGDDAERAGLEAEFLASARALAPRWDEVFPALSTSGTSWLQSADLETNAIAWRTEAAGADRYAIEGEVQILPGASKQMNVLLGRGQTTFVQVAFIGDYGIDILRFDGALEPERRWTRLATVEVKGLVPGRWIPFRVTVDGPEVAVSVAGQPACNARVESTSLRGAWGLGALADAAGLWRKIGFGRL